jgi:hypothetical protein
MYDKHGRLQFKQARNSPTPSRRNRDLRLRNEREASTELSKGLLFRRRITPISYRYQRKSAQKRAANASQRLALPLSAA